MNDNIDDAEDMDAMTPAERKGIEHAEANEALQPLASAIEAAVDDIYDGGPMNSAFWTAVARHVEREISWTARPTAPALP